MTSEFLHLPKIELHLHLDCSLSFDVVRKIKPDTDWETYRRDYVAPSKCTDLADYISRAVSAINLMQTREHLRWVTLDLMEQLREDGAIYAEVRFAPLLHTQQGLAPAEVVQTVEAALAEGMAQTGVEARLILCTLRNFSEAQSMETVRLTEQFAGTLVVGFDIAADEAGFPIDNHISAFAYAREKGIHVTAHAGEAKGPESVWETLQHFHPARIGHGVRSAEDEALLAFLKSEDIHLELCPTSNVQTNVVATIEDHPAEKIWRNGVSMSINTDGRALSDVTLTQEYDTMRRVFGWQKERLLQSNLEALRHAFIPEEVKARLRARLLEGWGGSQWAVGGVR